MVQGHGISFFQLAYHPGSYSFFTNPQVHLAWNPAFLPKPGNFYFKKTASQHIPV
jgi:hypothetical protein